MIIGLGEKKLESNEEMREVYHIAADEANRTFDWNYNTGRL